MKIQAERHASISTGHLRLSDPPRSAFLFWAFYTFFSFAYSPKFLYPIFNETVSIIQFAFPLVRTNVRLLCRYSL